MRERVFQSMDLAESWLVRSLLLDAGFHPPEVCQSDHITQFGGNQAYFVEVPEEEIDGARMLVAEKGYGAQLL